MKKIILYIGMCILMSIIAVATVNVEAGYKFHPNETTTTYIINTTQTGMTYIMMNETCLDWDGTLHCDLAGGEIQLFQPITPLQIRNLTNTSVDYTTINLEWNIPDDNTTLSILYVDDVNIANKTYPTNTTTITGLTENTQYKIQINSYNPGGENTTIQTNQINITTLDFIGISEKQNNILIKNQISNHESNAYCIQLYNTSTPRCFNDTVLSRMIQIAVDNLTAGG